jgi:broad specificity phosphatase PhoE
MEAFAGRLAGTGLTAVWSSDERKARDGGEVLAARLGLAHRVDPALGENDRSATGYLAPDDFWPVVQQFFAQPDESVRGWETARHAQQRIVAAIARIAATQADDAAIVSHGGVGRLLMAHLQGVEIGQEDRPQNPGGGCVIGFDWPPTTVTGWMDIEAWPG